MSSDNGSNLEIKKRGLPVVLIIGIVCLVIAAIVIISVVSESGSVAAKSKEKLDLGIKYLSELNYEQAIVAFNEAISIDPKNVDAYVKLSEAYVAIGDYDKAEEVLEKGQKETSSEIIGAKKEELKKKRESVSNQVSYENSETKDEATQVMDDEALQVIQDETIQVSESILVDGETFPEDVFRSYSL